MILPDVNVLVYAHRRDATDHKRYHRWLTDVISAEEPYGMAELVLASVVRILTNRRIFRQPSTLEDALGFADILLAQPNCTPIRPGPRHWSIFTRMCRGGSAIGALVPDAFFAALAIEHGCEWITCDRDHARFEGLRWRHPLA